MSARAVGAAIVAAGAARLSYSLLRAQPPGGAERWTRTNHRGDDITLLEGPALTIGGVAGALAAAAMTGDATAGGSLASERKRYLAMALAGAGAAAFGGYDDLAGNASSKGFRGHVAALRRGEVTTGVVKLAGIGATGLAAALLVGGDERGGAGRAGAAASVADIVINAGLVAGGANLVNLFDLRPGRAIKFALVAGALLAPSGRARSASAVPLAAAVALLPEDLGERAMLGDAGANALGAMLGVAATALPRRSRIAALAAVVGLTAASEVVSFSRVIERTGPLRWVDMLGRRPVPAKSPDPADQVVAAPVPASTDAATPDAASPDAASPDAAAPAPATLEAASQVVAAPAPASQVVAAPDAASPEAAAPAPAAAAADGGVADPAGTGQSAQPR